LRKDEQTQRAIVRLTEELSKAKSLDPSRSLLDAHQQEAVRLAKQLDAMTNDKAVIDNRCKVLEQENKELTENFLYIKNKYDTLVTAHSVAQASSVLNADTSALAQKQAAEYREQLQLLESQLSSAQSALDNTLAEKNKMSKRADSLSRDLDKSRSQIDSSTQRLIDSNRMLSEEKVEIELELERMKNLYDEQSSQLRSMTNVSFKSDDRIGEAVDDYKKALDSQNEEIKKLQKENENLKSRVRKLAAM